MQGLRCGPSTEKTNRAGTGRHSRRPSSAPARRQRENVVSEGRYLSPCRGRATSTEATFTAGTRDNGGRICHTAPGVWGVEECKELRNALVRSMWPWFIALDVAAEAESKCGENRSSFLSEPASILFFFAPHGRHVSQFHSVRRCDIKLNHNLT